MQQLLEAVGVFRPYGGQLVRPLNGSSACAADGCPVSLASPAISISRLRTIGVPTMDIVQYPNNHRKTIASICRKDHLFVGTDDTFIWMSGHSWWCFPSSTALHQIEFVFRPGRSTLTCATDGNDHYALFDRNAAEMYNVARPDKNRSLTHLLGAQIDRGDQRMYGRAQR